MRVLRNDVMRTIRQYISYRKEERGVHMEPEYDMEVTPERANTIKERLVQLLEDQMGCKLTVTVIDKGKEPA